MCLNLPESELQGNRQSVSTSVLSFHSLPFLGHSYRFPGGFSGWRDSGRQDFGFQSTIFQSWHLKWKVKYIDVFYLVVKLVNYYYYIWFLIPNKPIRISRFSSRCFILGLVDWTWRLSTRFISELRHETERRGESYTTLKYPPGQPWHFWLVKLSSSGSRCRCFNFRPKGKMRTVKSPLLTRILM